MVGVGGLCTRSSKATATPKFPPPPPRHAHQRSCSSFDFDSAEIVPSLPSGVTMSIETRLSTLRPYDRETKLSPPPSINPGMPTVGQPPPMGMNPVLVFCK